MNNELVRVDSEATQRRAWSAAEAAAHPALGIHKPSKQGAKSVAPPKPPGSMKPLGRAPKATVTPISAASARTRNSMESDSSSTGSSSAGSSPGSSPKGSSETLVSPAPVATASETVVSPPPVASAGAGSETVVTASPKFDAAGERIDAAHLIVADELDEELDGMVELSSSMLVEESEPVELLDSDLVEEIADDAVVASAESHEDIEEVDSEHLAFIETRGEFEDKKLPSPAPIDVSSVSLSALHETLHNQAVDAGLATYTTGVPFHSLERNGRSGKTFEIPAQSAPTPWANPRILLMAGIFLAGIGAGVYFGMPKGSSEAAQAPQARAAAPLPLAAATDDPNFGEAAIASAPKVTPLEAAPAAVAPAPVVQPLVDEAPAPEVAPLPTEALAEPAEAAANEAAAQPEAVTQPEPEAQAPTVTPLEEVAKQPAPKKNAKTAPRIKKERAVPASDPGVLMLGAKPPCDILIDGKRTGLTTPQRSLKLPAGKHKVTLVNREHKIRTSFRVVVNSGKTTRVVKDLTGKLR